MMGLAEDSVGARNTRKRARALSVSIDGSRKVRPNPALLSDAQEGISSVIIRSSKAERVELSIAGRSKRSEQEYRPNKAVLEHVAPGPSVIGRQAEITKMIQVRAARSNHFSADLFADPAWDILLDVALSTAERRRVSVSSLCLAAAVPTTTAHSWIVRLLNQGLLSRVRDQMDRRRCWVTMTAKAEAGMVRYLDSVARGPG
jgi:hypothetical protein